MDECIICLDNIDYNNTTNNIHLDCCNHYYYLMFN